MILELSGVDTYYGTSHVLQGVALAVGEGESVALLGRNGVGKTTTLRSIIGLTPARAGSITFLGQEIRGLPADAVARRGIAYVPDDHRIFPGLTADENLELSRRMSIRRGPWNRERVKQLFPRLEEVGPKKGLNLSGGEKRMLAIGRALMANPALILLDEPSEGLAPLVVEALLAKVNELKAQGLTILLAEQGIEFSLALADRVYVLEKGAVRFAGSSAALRSDRSVLDQLLMV